MCFIFPPFLRRDSTYKKVVFREYEKDFRQAKAHPSWLGLLGPTLRAEVGETIVVTFRNMANGAYSIHPHGVTYGKRSEGANYFDNTSQREKEDDIVQPNREHVYYWEVTQEVSPLPDDPNCLTYTYISHRNVVQDYNSGLIGALLICKPGTLDELGEQAGLHREFVLLFGVFDEKESLFSPNGHSPDDHVKYTINGYTEGALPGQWVRPVPPEGTPYSISVLLLQNIRHSANCIGEKYKKVVYTLYKNESFTEKSENKQRRTELGILGPVIRAQIRDVITIVFKNLASRPYSIYPHGLTVEKSEEGVNYPEGGNQSHAVQPGETRTYVWKVLEENEPLEADPRCLTRMYHSAVDAPRDISSGLIGPILICKSQSLDVRNVQLRADKEQHAVFSVFDENKSWYLEDNIQHYCDRSKVNKADPDFYKSNVMHTINGYAFKSGPVLGFCNGEVATWHVSSIGAQDSIQTATFYGHPFELNQRTEDFLSLYPMTGETIKITMDNIGVWLLASLNEQEITKGMGVKFQDVECYRDLEYDFPDKDADFDNAFNGWKLPSYDEIKKEEKSKPQPMKPLEIDPMTEMFAEELGLRSLRNQSGNSDVEILDLSFLDYDAVDVPPVNKHTITDLKAKNNETESFSNQSAINHTKPKEVDDQNIAEPYLQNNSISTNTTHAKQNLTQSFTDYSSTVSFHQGVLQSNKSTASTNNTFPVVRPNPNNNSAKDTVIMNSTVLNASGSAVLKDPKILTVVTQSSDNQSTMVLEATNKTIQTQDNSELTKILSGNLTSKGKTIESNHAANSNTSLDIFLPKESEEQLLRGDVFFYSGPVSDTSIDPTSHPSNANPTVSPSDAEPTISPSNADPTDHPTNADPTVSPSNADPTVSPSNADPTVSPSNADPTVSPSNADPTTSPSNADPTGSLSNANLNKSLSNITIPQNLTSVDDHNTTTNNRNATAVETNQSLSRQVIEASTKKYFDNKEPRTTPPPKKYKKLNLRKIPNKGEGMKTRRRKEYKPQARSGLPFSPRGFHPGLSPRGARPNVPQPVTNEELLINTPVVIGVPRPDFSDYQLYVPGDEPDHLEIDEQDVTENEYEYVMYKDPYSSQEDFTNLNLDETTKYYSKLSGPEVRTYFIAAEEVKWDYAGYGKRRREKSREDERETKFTKVVFRGYLDSSFTTLDRRGEMNEHLGILGPIIKAEVGQSIMVVFKNKADRPYSLHPNGVSYTKQFEGLSYEDGSKHWYKYDNEVQPNATYTYIWKTSDMVGPAPNESDCRTWAYYSGVNPERDIHSGLIGPLLVCRKGTLNKTPLNTREFVLLFMTFDESQSWYYERNREVMLRKKLRRVYYSKEKLKFHSINGIIYSLKGLRMYTNQLVKWHLINMGSPKDVHSVYFHGQTFTHVKSRSSRQAVFPLLPGSFDTLEMYPSKPGLWQLETEVSLYQKEGMQTLFLVLDNDCCHPLGLESGSVKDDRISASDTRGPWEPHLARLNNQGKYNAWSTEKKGNWIQVDFDRPVVISQVATQGAREFFQSQYATNFSISYSNDGQKWFFYKGDSRDFCKTFQGNNDAYGIKKNTFFPPLVGRYIRLHPITWDNAATIRMEFYGCELDGCSVPLGLESGLIEDSRITASSEASSWFNGDWKASLARLNKQGAVNAWRAKENDMNQWLQVELPNVKKITGIVTQGAKSIGKEMYVMKYALQYSDNGIHWTYYTDIRDLTVKVFDGNTNNDDHVKNYIYPPIFSRFIRIVPKRWWNSITMRVEILGCDFE
uniref:Coagulation factor V n=1 Tax=Cyprinodon variegatus TaxID=28743 RepID=A0A3Q2C9B7_CYPVA